MEKADVVIIGGGIAGLATAATLCVESDLDVVLVERREIGNNQTARAVFAEAIDEFDLRESVLQDHTGFIMDSPLGSTARFEYDRVALCSVDYQKLCQILYQRAVDHGLRLHTARANTWSPAIPSPDQPVMLHLSNGHTLQTQVVIDASGSAQWAANRLGIQRSPYYSVCYGELLTGCNFDDSYHFRLLAPNQRYGNGGGWVYPVGDGAVSFGYALMVHAHERTRLHVAPGYWAAKREYQPYADLLKDGVRERVEGGIIPIGRIGQFVADRVLIVGDAAGHANPWWVEGCRPALINGRSCARVVQRAFEHNRFDRAMLAPYEEIWKKKNGEPFWRAESVTEITWWRSDEKWDQFVKLYKRLSPQRQLALLRDNRTPFFDRAYAKIGYARRQLVKWMRGKWLKLAGRSA